MRPKLVTSVRDVDFDLELNDNFITVRDKSAPNGSSVMITIYNTCWIIPAEVPSVVSEIPSNPIRTPKKTAKKDPVVRVELPTADRFY
jgi:hypothetical protein